MNFSNIFLCSLFHHTKCSYSNWYGFCFIFHISAICISRSLYLLSFSKSLADILLSDGTLICIRWHVLFCFCLITIFGLLACIVMSVLMEKYHRMVIFWISTTSSGLCSYHLLGVSVSYWLQIFQFIYCPARLCLFVYSFGARIVHGEMSWSAVSLSVLQNLHLRSVSLWRILAWKFLVKRLWSCMATTNPSTSTLCPAFLSHWEVSCKSPSTFSFEVGIGSIDSLLSLYLSNSFQLSSIFRILHLLIKFSFKI